MSSRSSQVSTLLLVFLTVRVTAVVIAGLSMVSLAAGDLTLKQAGLVAGTYGLIAGLSSVVIRWLRRKR